MRACWRPSEPTPSTATLTLAAMPRRLPAHWPSGEEISTRSPHGAKPGRHQAASHKRLIPHPANMARLRQPDSQAPECCVHATTTAARAATHNVLLPLTRRSRQPPHPCRWRKHAQRLERPPDQAPRELDSQTPTLHHSGPFYIEINGQAGNQNQGCGELPGSGVARRQPLQACPARRDHGRAQDAGAGRDRPDLRRRAVPLRRQPPGDQRHDRLLHPADGRHLVLPNAGGPGPVCRRAADGLSHGASRRGPRATHRGYTQPAA